MQHWLLLAKDKLGFGTNRPSEIEAHLAAAAEWILRAQRATPDDGVAHSYDVKQRKWIASYPETTGYLIPTLYDYAQHFDAAIYRTAAQRMAEWEVAEQLPGGGVRAGTMAAEQVVPTIFNTGQVLFGFARAALETGEERFRVALKNAADWLVSVQDADGRWSRYSSPFTTTTMATYNTRTAFGLVRAFQVLPEQRYMDAANRNVAWALSIAKSNGWLPGNCLTENRDDSALTHTIAYSIRGILEVGVAVQNERYIDHALIMAKAVANRQNSDGSLSGYYTPDWKAKSKWSCITGNAQMAINWFRLARITGQTALIAHAVAANQFNMSVQNLYARIPGVLGAIKGSHPINGDYMTWRYPNWAAKFFMDALMFEKLNERVDNIG